MAHPVLIESKYSGYALLWAGTSGALAGIVIVLLLAYMCYSSKLYKMLPGWGPISRFDADATDELRYRQEVFKHSQEQAGFQRVKLMLMIQHLQDFVAPAIGSFTKHFLAGARK